MENPSSLEQNLNDLSRLMVDLKHTKDQVAIRGKWDMVAWLKNVRVRESQVNELMKEYNENTTGFFLKDVFYSKLIESLEAVKILIGQGNAGSESIPVQLSSLEKNRLKLFSSEDLKKFTDFDKILGRGGYSTVYQGEFEGEQVAVKVLKKNDVVYETFLTERITMGRIFHKNLVKLHGFCFDDDIKAIVYEYMEKGSFDKILYKNPCSVEWSQLYGIALEIARGIAYLHGKRLIHRDVKAANVLLNKNMCPKITDFGVSNLIESDATHVTNTNCIGTYGYAAPEIGRLSFPITPKSDVFSFGVMLFEILGRRFHIMQDGKWFPKEVSEMWKKQPEIVLEYCGIMDEDRENAMIMLMVAMWCVQYTATSRPSMSDVVGVLEKKMTVKTPPDPFKSHNLFGPSMIQEIPVNEESSVELEEHISKEYSQLDLEEFTSGFSDSNIIGTGSRGNVYRGEFPDGVEVAIKVFAHDSDIGREKFIAEGEILGALNHKNIIKTYGYCFDKNMIALVYEYMPRGSLDKILFEKCDGIEWGRLYNIVIEIAKGLSYLHEGHRHQTIHRDLKPHSILLDNNLSPKISNFELAKSLARDVSAYTITRSIGTEGYIAPEFGMLTSLITSKVDVYSFGIILFEVLARRRNSGFGRNSFQLQVWKKFETGKMEELIEDCGIARENREDAKILSMIAFWCIQYTVEMRPSMRTVVNMLEKILPVRPPPCPFNYYVIDDNGIEMKEQSEALLELYEKRCPPGGENSVILYTTTIEKMKRPLRESNYVRAILQAHEIKMIEREVYGDVDYEDELYNLMEIIQIPVLFVKGRLIGGAREVKKLEAEGKLKVIAWDSY